MKSFIYILCCLFVLCFCATSTYALDISVQAVPEMTIPIGPDSSLYSVGVGGTAHATISLFNFFAPGIQTGIQIQPLLNVGNSLTLVRAGVEANFYFYPVSRLYINGGGAFGSYIGTHPNASDFSGLYWSAHADVGFRFSPAFTLSAEAEYRSYLYIPDPVFSGLSVGISAQLQLGALSKKNTGVIIEGIEEKPVFPILYTTYNDVFFGTVRIINNEQAELRDVKIYFQAGEYTSREFLVEEIPFLRKGGAVEVPLYALFNEEILAFSENTKVEGEILVAYTFLNAVRETRQSQSISIYHRNSVRWQDNNIVAAFISPNDPAVLEYSKFIAGIVREKVRPGINDNLQYGMGLFEGLRLSEIAFTPDPSTPYQEIRNNESAVDYIQYPYQTIAYKGGERDDIGLLYAAALESVGIHAAYIPLQDEFLVAVDMNMDEKTARSRFYYDDELIYIDGKAWVPIQVSRIKEGFMRAWIEGIKLWEQYAEGPENPPFIQVTDAWKQYPSVGVYGDPSAYPKPRDDKVVKAFENSLYRYIKREVDPQVDELTGRFGADGGHGRDFNRLGILYATYSLLPEAEEWFLKALEDDYMPAAVNLGNVSFLNEDYEAAVRYFLQALEYRPSHRGALIGLARAKYELDVFTEADELYQQIKEIDPDLAKRYSYLSSQVEGSVSRASSAADRKGDLLWDEQE